MRLGRHSGRRPSPNQLSPLAPADSRIAGRLLAIVRERDVPGLLDRQGQTVIGQVEVDECLDALSSPAVAVLG